MEFVDFFQNGPIDYVAIIPEIYIVIILGILPKFAPEFTSRIPSGIHVGVSPGISRGTPSSIFQVVPSGFVSRDFFQEFLKFFLRISHAILSGRFDSKKSSRDSFMKSSKDFIKNPLEIPHGIP